MTISPLMFRNVTTVPDDPIETWPHEVVRACLEYGQITDWAPICAELRRDPHGRFATTVEETLDFLDPAPPVMLIREVLEHAREGAAGA